MLFLGLRRWWMAAAQFHNKGVSGGVKLVERMGVAIVVDPIRKARPIFAFQEIRNIWSINIGADQVSFR